jgi:hypothetical protein
LKDIYSGANSSCDDAFGSDFISGVLAGSMIGG